MRTPLLLVLLLEFVGLLTNAYAATEGKEYVDDVKAKLDSQVEQLSGQNYRELKQLGIEPLPVGKAKRFPLKLEAGISYVIVAVCDQDCGRIILVLREQRGGAVHRIDEPTRAPKIEYVPSHDGSYAAEVTVSKCSDQECYVGVTVLARQAQARGPSSMERYPNRAFPFGGQTTTRAASYEECERRCIVESNCVALTYFKDRHQCRLMETSGKHFSDTNADSALRLPSTLTQKPPASSPRKGPAPNHKPLEPSPSLTSVDPVGDCNSAELARVLAGCSILVSNRLASSSELAVALSRRSDAHAAAGDFDQTIADRKQALDLQPNDAAFRLRLSGAYRLRAAVRSKTSSQSALVDLAEAIRVDPSNFEARLERSAIYFVERNPGRAIEEIKSVIQADGDKQAYSDLLAGFLEVRANEHMLKRSFPAAIADYTEAIILQPRNAALFIARGDAAVAKGDEQQAKQDYTAAIQLKSDFAQAYLRRGESYYRTGAFFMSTFDLNEALRLNDRDVTAWLTRANVHEASGQHDHARSDYAKVLTLEPTNAIAKTGVARTTRALEIEVALKQLAERNP